MSTAWIFLLLAIGFELSGSIALKLSDGFSRLIPSLLTFPAYGMSFVLLAMALKSIPISVAYAVWSAIGTAAIAAIGMIWFREPASAFKVLCIGLIILGVIGVRMADTLAADGVRAP